MEEEAQGARAIRASLRAKTLKKKSWAVYTEKGDGITASYRPVFRVGNQYFSIGYTCTGDEGGKRKAKWFCDMFLIALKHMGVNIKKRKRR